MIEQYIDALESELRAAAGRRGRLAAARAPRPATGVVATTLAVLSTIAIGAVFLGLHGRSSTRQRHTNLAASLSSALGPEAVGFTGVPPASGRAALMQAARAAAAGTATPALSGDEAWYSSAEELDSTQGFSGPPDAHALPVIQARRSIEVKWFPAGGEEHTLSVSLTRPTMDSGGQGTPSDAAGFGDWDAMQNRKDGSGSPSEVLRALDSAWAGYLAYTPGNTERPDLNSTPFTILARAAAILGDEPVSPASRAAILRALATLPNLSYQSHVRDPLGRPAVAVTETTSSVRAFATPGLQQYEQQLMFNPATGTVLADRTIAVAAIPALHIRADTVVFSWAYRLTRVVLTANIPSLSLIQSSPPGVRAILTRSAVERRQVEAPGQPCHPFLTPGGGLRSGASGGRCGQALRAIALRSQTALAHDPAMIRAQRALVTPPRAVPSP